MSSQNQPSISPTGNEAETPDTSPETLVRCAQLLATDEIDWPRGLSEEQESFLVIEVRRFRRARLVKFIAFHIAADVAREMESRTNEARP